MVKKITLLVFLIMYSSFAYTKNISGTYVASTNYGNIFCLDIAHKNDSITGSFDEVDFKQIVTIDNGTYKKDKLEFDVTFKVNQRKVRLLMSANKIMDKPVTFAGNYTIGSEKGDFILYQILNKPKVCKMLYVESR